MTEAPIPRHYDAVRQRWLVTGAVILAVVTTIVLVARDDEHPCMNQSEDVVQAPPGGSARDALVAFMRDNPTSLVGRQDLDDLSGSTGNPASEHFFWDDDQVFADVERADMAATSWHVRHVGRGCSADPINP